MVEPTGQTGISVSPPYSDPLLSCEISSGTLCFPSVGIYSTKESMGVPSQTESVAALHRNCNVNLTRYISLTISCMKNNMW